MGGACTVVGRGVYYVGDARKMLNAYFEWVPPMEPHKPKAFRLDVWIMWLPTWFLHSLQLMVWETIYEDLVISFSWDVQWEFSTDIMREEFSPEESTGKWTGIYFITWFFYLWSSVNLHAKFLLHEADMLYCYLRCDSPVLRSMFFVLIFCMLSVLQRLYLKQSWLER